jgi:hypothetical protein
MRQEEHRQIARTEHGGTPAGPLRPAPLAQLNRSPAGCGHPSQARYHRGLAKTHLQHVLTALALNLVRLDAWLTGIPPGSS